MPTTNKFAPKLLGIHIFLFTTFILAVCSFYSATVYSGEDGTESSANCYDASDNDSDGWVDFQDLDCLYSPSAIDLRSASDSGVRDGITNIATPIFDVVCSDNMQVNLYSSSVLIGGIGICSGGSVAINVYDGVLSDGTYSITARQFGVAENITVESSDSPVYTLTIDTVASEYSSARPLEDVAINNVTNSSDISYSIQENVNSGSLVITRVSGAVDNNVHICYFKGTALEAGVHTLNLSDTVNGCTSDVSSLVDGAVYDFLFNTLYDLAGNGGQSVTHHNITYDISAPVTSGAPDLSPSSDSGSSSTDNITTESVLTFTGACVDGDEINLYSDGSITGNPVTCASSAFSITSGGLTEGIHSITFKETDLAGNVSTASSALTITIDTTAPSTSGAPDMTSGTDAGSSDSDNITSNTTPIFTGICADGNTVQIFDNGSSSGSSSVCTASAFSLAPGTLASGVHLITFKETDPAGNVSASSSALSVTVDTSAPVVSDTPIEDGTDTTPSYMFNTDEVGEITYGGSCSSLTTVATLGSNTVIFEELAVGTYTDCTIMITDAASNESNVLNLAGFTISEVADEPAPEAVVAPVHRVISGSSPSRPINTTMLLVPNAPKILTCKQGDLYNSSNGLLCADTTELPIGCFENYLFSTLTGKPCLPSTVDTKNIFEPTLTPSAPAVINVPKKFKFTKDLVPYTLFSDDAKELQIFLNSHGFFVASSGAGSPGNENRYFGPATQKALARFQASAGIVPSVGYFGPKTRSYINNL